MGGLFNPPPQPPPPDYISYAYDVIGEDELTVTIPANTTTPLQVLAFNPDTLFSGTIYISNTQNIPLGATQNIMLYFLDWKNSVMNTLTLDNYKYGRYFENYPIQTIAFVNNYPVDLNIYIQYSIKKYYEFYSPVVQDLTQLQLTPSIITPSLLGGTNFLFSNSIANLNVSNIPLNSTIYVIQQQVYGTSSTAPGSVTISWNGLLTLNLPVSALGTYTDSNEYPVVVDSTTQALPGSVTSTNASLNWVQVELFSPIAIKTTTNSIPIIYNSKTNTFALASSASISASTYAVYMPSLPAAFCQYALS
ncbi:MAG: hypothetical protein ACP5MB_10300 [bacterium]